MKKIFLGLLAMMVSVTLFAAPRTMEEAAQIAAQFTNQQPKLRTMHKAPRAAANMRLAHKALQNNSEAAAYYIFNQEGNNGFVIVSADDRTAEDVLGYTENGSFDANNINPNLRWWLDRYAEEITVLQTIDDSQLQPRKAVQVTAIANLLVTQDGTPITWYQETPYNNLCPTDQRDNTTCLTGCVATAASQIMYKWRHPLQGTGSSSYTWYNCKNNKCTQYWTSTLSADYGNTTYDWDNMLPAYEGVSYTTTQATAVATLMHHVGVAAKMGYGGQANNGSGAWTDNMGFALKTYFGYQLDKFISMYSQSNYRSMKGSAIADIPYEFSVTRDQFTTYFNADLEAGRPIIMGGEDSDGGHEFVCCGRDSNNKFYINWGWEGSGDGYYAISSLTPGSYNFSSNLDALIGLRPKQDLPPVTVTWSVNGVPSTTQVVPGNTATPETTPAGCQNGKVFVGWTEDSNVDGDRPADLFTTGKVINEATTFYAVYATAEEGSSEPTNDYKKITSTTELEDGNYIVVGSYNSKYYAMKNQLTSNGYYIDQQQVTPASGIITTTDGNIIWQIALTNNTLSFYNVAESKYVHIYLNSTYTNAGFTTSASGNIHFTYTVSNGSWDFVNTAITGKNHLEYYGSKSDFTAYTSAGDPIYLYKQQVGPSTTYSGYTTILDCGTTAIENQVVTPTAMKVLKNGQLFIIIDNQIYSILGQKIQ